MLLVLAGCAGVRQSVHVVVEVRPPIEEIDGVARVEYRWDVSPR